MTRRIVVKGVKRSEISTEDLANLFYLQAKRALRERREAASKAKAKAKRREHGAQKNERSGKRS
jgi:hypothetical protein